MFEADTFNSVKTIDPALKPQLFSSPDVPEQQPGYHGDGEGAAAQEEETDKGERCLHRSQSSARPELTNGPTTDRLTGSAEQREIKGSIGETLRLRNVLEHF